MHTVSRLEGRVSDIHNARRRGNESVSQRFQSLPTVPPPLFKSEFYCIFQLLRSLLSPAILVCVSWIASSGHKSLGLWRQQIEHLSGEKSGGDIFACLYSNTEFSAIIATSLIHCARPNRIRQIDSPHRPEICAVPMLEFQQIKFQPGGQCSANYVTWITVLGYESHTNIIS